MDGTRNTCGRYCTPLWHINISLTMLTLIYFFYAEMIIFLNQSCKPTLKYAKDLSESIKNFFSNENRHVYFTIRSSNSVRPLFIVCSANRPEDHCVYIAWKHLSLPSIPFTLTSMAIKDSITWKLNLSFC